LLLQKPDEVCTCELTLRCVRIFASRTYLKLLYQSVLVTLYIAGHKCTLTEFHCCFTGVPYHKFNVYGSVPCKNIPIYIQQNAKLQSLFYLETALHVSGGTSSYHQERIQMYLQHLVFVTPLLLPAAIVEVLELV